MKKISVFIAIILCVFATKAQPYPVMVKVKGGAFMMGNNSSAADAEKPAHRVIVGDFSIGKFEVTVAEFKAYCRSIGESMPAAPLWRWNDKYPMTNVDRADAEAYCDWLSEKTGRIYRLPTEAEWEYAARGGIEGGKYEYAGSNNIDEVGWSKENSPKQPQPVGLKKPNQLGLYDMSGNADEWCLDWYDKNYYKSSSAKDPEGPESAENYLELRVTRGGNWFDVSEMSRITARGYAGKNSSGSVFGFRVVESTK